METLEALRPDIIHVPSRQEDLDRLRAELPIVPNTPEIDALEDDRYAKTSVTLWRKEDGSYDWRLSFGHRPEGSHKLDPASDVEDGPIFDLAASLVREGDRLMPLLTKYDGRWWDSTLAEQSVQNDLREVFEVSEDDNKLEVLNCSSEDLSEDEIIALQNAFNAVVNFTGGKIFDRVRGVALVDNGDLKEKEASGDFDPAYGIVRINMADVRRADKEVYPRYQPYFRGREDITITEIILTHELGHAMDLRLFSEVEAHRINQNNVHWSGYGNSTSSFSAFQDSFGWRNTIYERAEDRLKANKWRFNEAEELECREYAPTAYAKSHPQEDFAETFAIMALGGDMSSMPQRQKLIAETIMKAEAPSTIGPKLVTLEKVDCDGEYDLRKLKALALDVFVIG